MRALADEMFAAAASVRLRHIERIAACGVSISAIATLGTRQHQFGVAAVRAAGQGLYEPDPDGEPAVIVPVMGFCDIEPFEGFEVDIGEIVDLVAFKTSDPANWLWRTGEGFALGLHMLDSDFPVPLVRLPIEWLALAGQAITILDWEAPARFWSQLREGPGFTWPDARTKQLVDCALIRSVGTPTLEVRDAA